ncbi:hypothetical protein LSUB1_G000486 [Lachnellula subtilissima]|uniref:Uncharacterized protein n=1 Tax=Lachnellula subtilissima TaxID=602034 RepID=A0A8H8S342_9HELO|nr:hypothetical protein LSUB1_G000486 [Lachnellula subtilissima]
MPLDRMTLTVPHAKRDAITSFLATSLHSLSLKEIKRPLPHTVGLGEETAPYFWLNSSSAEQVRRFHAAALKASPTYNDAPDPRPQYYLGYYAAFVHEPVFGINIEVVSHGAVK